MSSREPVKGTVYQTSRQSLSQECGGLVQAVNLAPALLVVIHFHISGLRCVLLLLFQRRCIVIHLVFVHRGVTLNNAVKLALMLAEVADLPYVVVFITVSALTRQDSD